MAEAMNKVVLARFSCLLAGLLLAVLALDGYDASAAFSLVVLVGLCLALVPLERIIRGLLRPQPMFTKD